MGCATWEKTPFKGKGDDMQSLKQKTTKENMMKKVQRGGTTTAAAQKKKERKQVSRMPFATTKGVSMAKLLGGWQKSSKNRRDIEQGLM